MSFPPPGYDDESVITQQRVRFLLGKLESELSVIQRVFEQHLPGEFPVPHKLEGELVTLRSSADELGLEYGFLIEKLVSDYRLFKEGPDPEKLSLLFQDIKSLQLLLVS